MMKIIITFLFTLLIFVLALSSCAIEQQAPIPNYILTGILIDPDSAAFILNPATSEELFYKIGDKIDEWEVIEIAQTKIKLSNKQGRIITLQLAKRNRTDYSEVLTPQMISFVLEINADKSPISPTTIFKYGNCRIYACFTNQGALAKLSKVIMRWTNKTTHEIIRLEIKPINPNAPFNYICLEKKDGWTVGEYITELFNPKTLEIIAFGSFRVENSGDAIPNSKK